MTKVVCWFKNSDYHNHFRFDDPDEKFEVFQELYHGGCFVHEGRPAFHEAQVESTTFSIPLIKERYKVCHDRTSDIFYLCCKNIPAPEVTRVEIYRAAESLQIKSQAPNRT